MCHVTFIQKNFKHTLAIFGDQFSRLPRVKMEIAASSKKSQITPFLFAEKTVAEVQLTKNSATY
jgi:hypothetical protein